MKYQQHSQHANTSNPEYHGDGASYSKNRMRFWYEDQVCEGVVVATKLRLAFTPPVDSRSRESMFHHSAYTGEPADIEIVMPEGWTLNPDGSASYTPQAAEEKAA